MKVRAEMEQANVQLDASWQEERDITFRKARRAKVLGYTSLLITAPLMLFSSLYLIRGKAGRQVLSTLEPARGAAERAIGTGDWVRIENSRGWLRVRAVVTNAVRRGVVASPKGRWSKRSGGRNVNWTTSDALGDMQRQNTFHNNRVWVRRE